MIVPVLFALAFLRLVAADGSWVSFHNLGYLFVFGDSYSTVGFRSTSPIPTVANPIGLKYPGTTISKGENWVGVVTTKANDSMVLTWDYAISGSQVTSVVKQVREQFVRTAGTKPEWSPWNETNSLFATWIGINDITRGDVVERITLLFELQNDLYQSGARNFLFLNVPPFDRSPGGANSTVIKSEITKWNDLLPLAVTNFTSTHPNVRSFIYDTQALWAEFYAKPSAFNITNTEVEKGGLWYDGYHPSTEIQVVIGQRIAQFLREQV